MDISPGRQEVRVPSTVGFWPPLKLISMIDKEYIKGIISRITDLKTEKNVVPATASMQEIMIGFIVSAKCHYTRITSNNQMKIAKLSKLSPTR